LVRASTGDTVAVYAGLGDTDNSSVVGMFRFIDDEEDDVRRELGRSWEVMAMLSVVCVIEGEKAGRRARKDYFW